VVSPPMRRLMRDGDQEPMIEVTNMKTLHRVLGFPSFHWLRNLSIEVIPIVKRSNFQELEQGEQLLHRILESRQYHLSDRCVQFQ
jgi:hypothetical protein